MFKRLSLKSAAERKKEELLYELAFEELSSDNIRPGLWAKAMVQAEGDDSKVKSIYLKYRVQSMLDEEQLELEKKMLISEANKRELAESRLREDKPKEPDIFVLDRQGQKRELFPQEGGGYLAKTKAGEKFFSTKDEARDYFK